MLRRRRVGRGLNRHEEIALELRLGAEQARMKELHHRPQVADVVLDRGAGKRDAIAAFERARRARLLALGILDILRLVQNDPRPRELGQRREVAMQQAVAGDHEVVRTGGLEEAGLLLGARGPVMHQYRQTGGEASRLMLPIAITEVGQIRRTGGLRAWDASRSRSR